METISSILKWLFFDSVYGIGLIAMIIYLLMTRIKKIIPRLPSPLLVSTLIVVIGLFTVPSIPRYQFSQKTLSSIDGKPWIKIIHRANWGSIIEPLTWFNAPLGSIFIAMPYDPVSMGSFDFFQEVLVQYKEEDQIRVIERFCTENKIQIYKYDEKGTLRFATNKAQKMTKEEKERYCEYDWSKERSALFHAMKKDWN